MLTQSDINDILNTIRQDFPTAQERDIAYVIISSEIEDRRLAYNLAYGLERAGCETHASTPLILKLRDILEPYGISNKKALTITRDQNTTEMLRLLKDIKQARERKEIDPKDALNMEKDIRAKLQDKFDIGQSQDSKRIIIVPQKHDLICPHTNRECSSMPTKEACMKYYSLSDPTQKEENS